MPSPYERVTCLEGDLTLQRVDAVVNAANEALRGGGGVDGALHRAAGPGLLAECVERWPDGCPTGQARLTRGYDLPAAWVIHTVGPVWHGGQAGEPEALASCFVSSLGIAHAHGLRTVAFPAISCGVYGYPAAEAARVALATLGPALELCTNVEAVRLVLFGPELHEVFASELQRRCA